MIFNSLGSNYNFDFVLKSLFAGNSDTETVKLKSFLENKYGGETILLYKGREALKLALTLAGLPKGAKVGVNGFTCFVVYQAISEAGFNPVYLDIDAKSLNFSIGRVQKNKDLKALIIQNTLGNPVNIEAVEEFCKSNNVVLIEDLAHSAGGVYANGMKIGSVGDFAALSFSQDKIIDAVSGGALVVRTKKYTKDLNEVIRKEVPLFDTLHDRLYPLLTFKIRKLYPLGLGKLLHFLLKKSKALSDPIGSTDPIEYHKLPGWYASLALFKFLRSDEELKHRRLIAGIYLQTIDSGLILSEIRTNYKFSTNIRFPIFVKGRNGLIKHLKRNGIYVSDIWYDAPIAPAKLLTKTDYKGECPESETVSGQILNLPTHINISTKEAERISVLINKWLNTNQN
jgi:perosamine synthetase